MSKDTFQINIPISKIDEEQRIVTGIATTEALDSQGDIVDYDASKKAFADWQGIGNIREMHEPVAIGKAIDVQFDDAKKQVIVSAKISESSDGENTWTKIKEGVLSAYSIGGRIFEVTKDKAVEGADRIIDYALTELSLVDNPANPEAQLVMVKSVDGKARMTKAGIAVVDGDARDHSASSVSAVVAGTSPAKGGTVVPKKVYAADGKSTTNKSKDSNMKKSVYDAAEAISLASQLTWLILTEEPDQREDLITAFNALRDFAAKEVAEGDDFDFTAEYAEVVELSNKAISLRKGKNMSDKKVEKSTAVHAGEERDEAAEVVTTPEENGRPVNDTVERAEEVGVPAAAEGEPVVHESPEQDEKVEEPEVVDDKEVVEEPKADEPKDEEATAEAPEKTEDDGKKADQPSDLMKSMDTLLTKLNSGNVAEIKKVADLVTDLSAKVEKMDSLEERVSKLEKTPMPLKTKASYAVVEKGESEVTDETAALLKRQEELIAHPEDAKPGEMYELASKLRKANTGARIEIK